MADLTEVLPYRLRADVEDYVHAVDAALPDIARELGITSTVEVRDQFLFLIGVRRLWGAVNGSYWLASNVSALFAQADAPFVAAGDVLLGPGATINQELQILRSGLRELLEKNEIFEAVGLSHVSDVLRWVHGGDGRS